MLKRLIHLLNLDWKDPRKVLPDNYDNITFITAFATHEGIYYTPNIWHSKKLGGIVLSGMVIAWRYPCKNKRRVF